MANPYFQALRIQCEVEVLFNKALLHALSPNYDFPFLELAIPHSSLKES